MYGCRYAEAETVAAQLGNGHSHRVVVIDDAEYVQQHTGVSDDPPTLALSLKEAQNWHPQAHVIAGRRRMDETGDLLVASHRQERGSVEDIVFGEVQRGDSASASAAR
jgi:hypothetical protein